MKKIIHIISGLEIGGAERALENILKAGLAQNFNTSVISLKDEGIIGPNIKQFGVELNKLDIKNFLNYPGALYKLKRIINEKKPDLIQGWMPHGNAAALIGAKISRNKIPIIFNIRQCLYQISDEAKLTQKIIKINAKFSNIPSAIIYNSKIAKGHHELLGYNPDRAIVIPNGFNIDTLKPDKKLSQLVRSEYNISNKVTVFGHVARFHPMKDHITFIKAALEVLKHNKNVFFLMAGRDVSLQNKHLVNHIPKQFLKYFSLRGECSDLYKTMMCIDIFCQSSWTEAFPNVIGEAMACGIPCIATDVGETRRLTGGFGTIIPPRNSVKLSESMLNMMSLPKAELIDLGLKARCHIIDNFSLKRVTNDYIKLYNNVLK
jgi:glycosyltransferase involved in cell wall biosynthesis